MTKNRRMGYNSYMTILLPASPFKRSGRCLITSGLSKLYSEPFHTYNKIIAYQTFWRKGVSPSTPISNYFGDKTTRLRCLAKSVPGLGADNAERSWLMSLSKNGTWTQWSVRGWERYINSDPIPLLFILTLMAWAPSRNRAYGLWKSPIARRPCPQGVAAVCMGFGSCTVLIFSSPSTASLWAKKAITFFLGSFSVLTLTPMLTKSSTCSHTVVDSLSIQCFIVLSDWNECISLRKSKLVAEQSNYICILILYHAAGNPDATVPISVSCVRGSKDPWYCGKNIASVYGHRTDGEPL